MFVSNVKKKYFILLVELVELVELLVLVFVVEAKEILFDYRMNICIK